MTNEDLNDMIEQCSHQPNAATIEVLLHITKALNERIETLRQELLMEKRWRASILRGQGGNV